MDKDPKGGYRNREYRRNAREVEGLQNMSSRHEPGSAQLQQKSSTARRDARMR